MENIFEDAKFGDKFVTRDGRIAIYVEHNDFDDEYPHTLLVDKTFEKNMPNYDTLCFANNGDFDLRDNTHHLNIASCYQEPIDEEKLDELANNSANSYMYSHEYLINNWDKFYIEGFKAGYRKALEK